MTIKIDNKKGIALTVVLVVFTFFQLILIGIFNFMNISEMGKSSALLSKEQLAINLAYTNSSSISAEFANLANDPSSKEFKLIRDSAVKEFTRDVHLNHESIGSTGIDLSESTVESISRMSFGSNKKENYGILKFNSRAQFSRSGFRLIDEKVSTYKEYRIVFTGFIRPFNKILLFIEEPESLIDGEEFNNIIKDSFNNVIRIRHDLLNLKSFADQVVAEVREERDLPYLDEIVSIIKTLSVNFEAPAVNYYPKEFSLFSNSKTRIHLSILQKPEEVRKLTKKINLEAMETWITLNEIRSIIRELVFLTEEFEVKAIHDELEEHLELKFRNVQDFTDLQQRRLEMIHDFQTGVKALSKEKFDPEVASINFDSETLKEKAFFVLDKSNAEEKWRGIRENIPILNGIIYVDNRDSEFKLSGKIRGKLTLVFSGDVAIENLMSERTGRDHLNIISYGNINIQGRNRFNLYSDKNLILRDNNTSLEGSVYVVNSSRFSSNGSSINVNEDNLIENDTALYYFALAPRTLANIVNGEKE